MSTFPIGIILESLLQPIPEALDTIQRLGAQGVQVYTTKGELAPQNLTPRKKKDFLQMVKDRGLIISALVGDLGHGFGDAAKNPGLVEASKRILDLARDWETDIVTTHIGVVPADRRHPRYAIMQDACGALAAYADSLKAHFAVETGPETAETLRAFLDSLHSTGVAVNLDPANLVMVTGDDPVAAVHTLKPYIVHTHAKDGRKFFDKDPERIYGIVADDVVTDAAFIELPLGEGDVPFKPYLAALSEIGYKGFLTIEREVGSDPVRDITMAVDFLRRHF
ncbi:MAG: sugar phosphate isomerase/epimerase family protein [Christensenellales bacterium]